MNDDMRRELGVKMTQRKDCTNTCELTGTCPYYKGLFDMPEEYREQYCRRNYLWCGKVMRRKPNPRGRPVVSHGICQECVQKVEEDVGVVPRESR